MDKKEIDKPTEKIVYELDRKAKKRDNIRKVVYFLIGLGITIFLCVKCLPCNDCHVVVTIYLSLLSLVCFVNSGIPISSEVLKIFNKVT